VLEADVLEGPEMFMFGDNPVTEQAYFQGTPNSPAFYLIVQLRKCNVAGVIAVRD
jgi:hypothetical protein